MKKIYGVGINDSNYVVQKNETYYLDGKRKGRLVWMCPYYARWKQMLYRCYGVKDYNKSSISSYKDVKVSEEWLIFSNFKGWVIDYSKDRDVDIKDLYLDKDLILFGNNEYNNERCCFVPRIVNNFLTNTKEKEDDLYKKGVIFDPTRNNYISKCRDPFKERKSSFIGRFSTEEEAHEAYIKEKLRIAEEIKKRSLLSYHPEISDNIIRFIKEGLIFR